MKKTCVFLGLVLAFLLGAAPVLAQGIPKLPHAFYGSVTVNGAPAADGTQVSATVDIGEIIATQNPVTTAGGKYGIDSPYLLVQGYDIPDDASITFRVTNQYGTAIGGTATFEAGGGPTRRDLSVEIKVPPAPPGGGVTAPVVPTVTITGLTATVPLGVDAQGIVQTSTTLTTIDGKVNLNIPAGTRILDAQSNPLTSITAVIETSPPAPPPEGKNIIGLTYNFEPEGVTFDPPITLTFTYDPDDIPEGVAEEDLVLAFYDENLGEWIECECTCDPGNNCVTACVYHFTDFTIIAPAPPPPPIKPAAFSLSNLSIQPAETKPGQMVTVTVSVSNTGGTQGSYTVVLEVNGAEEQTQSISIAAGGTKEVDFTVSREEPGDYTVKVGSLEGIFTVTLPPAPPETSKPELPEEPDVPVFPTEKGGINWYIIGTILGIAVLLAIFIPIWIRRRREG